MRDRRRRWRGAGDHLGGQLPLRPLSSVPSRRHGTRWRGPLAERFGRRDRPVAPLPSVGLRVAVLGGVALVVFSIILFRLWFLQVLSAQQYVSAAENNRLRSIRVPALRGLILDRRGTTLVGNRPALTVGLRLMDVPNGRLASTVDGLARLLHMPVTQARESLARNAGYGLIPVAENLNEAALSRVRTLAASMRHFKEAKAALQIREDDVGFNMALLPEGELASALQALARIVKAKPDELYETLVRRAGYQYDLVVLEEDVALNLVSQILERKQSFPGVEIRKDHLRDYPQGTIAAHLFGNVGEVTAEELKTKQFSHLEQGDRVGHAGVEYTYDEWLRGQDGESRVEVDAFGRPKRAVSGGSLAQPGNNLVLSLDLKIQRAAERALQRAIEIAHQQHYWRANGAAAVVMEAKTGALVAMASYPAYDPSVWQTGTSKDFQRLASAGANYPLLNRAIQGSYPAASTFKAIDAIAALEQGVVTPLSTFMCDGSFEAYKQKWTCWVSPAGHGHMNITHALAQSCDVYFYNVGLSFYHRKGTELADWAHRLGFGKATGIDIPGEVIGRVPTPAWKRSYYKKGTWDYDWHPGDSINLSIGQGNLEVTPLQIAVAYAAIANGGKIVTPHLGLKVVDADGRSVLKVAATEPRSVDISPGTLDVVRQGLRMAASSSAGTSAAVFSGYPVAVAGKTGTAEWGAKDDCAWYASYAPADNPKYVVVVFVEQGGHGGSTAAPAARLIYDALFGLKSGTNVVTGRTD